MLTHHRLRPSAGKTSTKNLLALLYLARAAVFLAFIVAPLSAFSVLAFAGAAWCFMLNAVSFLALVLALSVVSTGLSLLLPLISKDFFDRALLGRDASALVRTCALFATVTVLPAVGTIVFLLLFFNTTQRLLHPPDVGSEGKEVVDLEQEAQQAVGLVINRDQFPDKLFAPAKRDDLMPDTANPVYEREVGSEIFSQGTLMLRLVIQVSMVLALPALRNSSRMAPDVPSVVVLGMTSGIFGL